MQSFYSGLSILAEERESNSNWKIAEKSSAEAKKQTEEAGAGVGNAIGFQNLRSLSLCPNVESCGKRP
jgi:hypothetical protein